MKTNKELLELYPWLKIKNHWTGDMVDYDEDDDICELDALERGWRIRFGDEMCAELDKILRKANYQDLYAIAQVKEKYGSLRWYDYNGVPKNIREEYNEWINKYEALSEKTCTVCGHDGKMDYSEAWIVPLCDDCRNKKRRYL